MENNVPTCQFLVVGMMLENNPRVSIAIQFGQNVPMTKSVLVVDVTMQHTVSDDDTKKQSLGRN